MPNYKVLHDSVLGHRKGAVVEGKEFGDHDVKRLLDLKAVEETSEKVATEADMKTEGDLTDGDGIALSKSGDDLSPLAPEANKPDGGAGEASAEGRAASRRSGGR